MIRCKNYVRAPNSLMVMIRFIGGYYSLTYLKWAERVSRSRLRWCQDTSVVRFFSIGLIVSGSNPPSVKLSFLMSE